MERIGEEPDGAEGLTTYCRMTVSDAGETRHRYAVNARGYAERFATYRLSAFEELAVLYAHLQQRHVLRLKVAAEWLSKHDAEAPRPVVETPHNEEWFAELERADPKKAAMTKAAIQAMGRDDCCSICGDDPAPLHRLQGKFLPGERVPTLRLCGDCVRIRASMGETFIPIV
jgi:hypothetical protein